MSSEEKYNLKMNIFIITIISCILILLVIIVESFNCSRSHITNIIIITIISYYYYD